MQWWPFTKRNAALERELRSDLELEEEEQRQGGLSPKDAHYAALRGIGNLPLIREETQSVWSWHWLDSLIRDLKYGLRGMRRNASSTALAIVIVGLGIAGASTVFSIVNALLLRPLPFDDPGRLVWLSNGSYYNTQAEHYSDLRDHNQSFAGLAGWSGAYSAGNKELTGIGEPERLTSVPVTDNFFPVLGVEPILGRSFTKEECQQQYYAPPAMLLSYNFWRRRFAADPTVVGRKITLNNQPVTVIGVLPESFDFAGMFAPGTPIDVFIPWPLTDPRKPMGNTMALVGRLKPSATLEGAQAEVRVLSKQLNSEHPERNPIDLSVVPLEQHVSGPARPALLVLMCAIGLVMFIVCANVSHLQLARMGARQKEMSIRMALGASRFRLLTQVLVESITLSGCGAVFGVLLAVIGTREVAHLKAFNLPLLASVRLDAATLLFALAAAVVSGVLFGLAPALQVSGLVGEALHESGRQSTGSRRHGWFRNALVVSEFALACVLLVGAALLIQSFLRVMEVNLGYEPGRTAALRIDPSFKLTGLEHQNVFIDEVLNRARSVPGVSAVGIADILPLAGDRSWQVGAQGQVYEKNHHPEAYVRVVTDGYFEALDVPLKSGRMFTAKDRAASVAVVIVNETLARTLWPGQDAIGQVMTQDGGRRVVGVVGDVHHGGPELSGGSEMYLPMRQTGDYGAMNLVMRTTLAPDSLAAGIRNVLRAVDPNLPVNDFQPLQALVDKAVSPRKFLVMLMTGFACFALLLASLGIYALISYSVSQRTKEIGIRMALGASRWLVQRQVLARTLRLAVGGVVLGTLGALILSRWIESLLFDTTAKDPAVFLAAILVLCSVAFVAAYLPSRRASNIDPMEALRTE